MSQPANVSPKRSQNPYVGPRAFRNGELFFGREAEKEGLLNKLLPGGVTLLYSPSGAGKTSLIQAAVVPELLDLGFQVCAASKPRFAALRVNLPPPPDLPIANRYVFSIVNGLIGHLISSETARQFSIADALDLFAEKGPVGSDEDKQSGTPDGTRADPPGGRPQQIVVIDQLEEVVTLDRNDMEGQREFFRQLGHALRRGRRWALLSMREDYVGHMDKFKRYFQNELRTTYRIDYLDPDAAMRAVEEPAAARGVTFEDEAARRLITDLRAVRADHPVQLIPRPSQQVSRRRRAEGIAPASGHRSDPSTSAPIATDVFVSTPGAAHGSPPTPTPTAAGTGPVVPDEPVVYPYVEPVLVQVVCDSLWRIRSKKPDFTRITVEDLAEVQPYNTTLSKYYRSVVREAAGRDADTERAVRDWVEQQLLTTRGLRQPTLTPPKVTDPTFVLGVLQQRYLIRDDPRPGGTWWELAHDMLVQPVIEDNRAWQLSNLAAWQVVADEWHRTGRPRDLLLQNSDLREARSAIRKIETTSLEHDFLQESIRAAEEAGRYRNAVFQLNFFRILVVLSLALNALFILRYFGWE